jgi:glycosyltransferase involved in cell wall biosynthesis
MLHQPSLLLVLPQLPLDSGSGAARSLTTISEMAAGAGYRVRALATTATELAHKFDAFEHLTSQGLRVGRIRKPGDRPELTFENRGISYRLLDTAGARALSWQKLYNRQFDLMFDQELDRFNPDLVLTFGGNPEDVRRRRRARRRGVKLVFGLRNLGYLEPGGLAETDAILSASQFVACRYREALGIESTALPLPLEMEDVIAAGRQPIFITMINPSPEKGLMVFARIAEEVARRRPTAALLVIESRGSAGRLAGAALAGGFDLRRHENILTSDAVPLPRDIYAGTRVLLAPSVWEEPAGRVVAEALVNGIPPIVSDRGGLAETANGGGFVVPIPREVTPETKVPVDAAVVEPWVELILRLTDDEEFYQQASHRALHAGRIYRSDELAPRYLEFFERVLEMR